MSPTYRVALRAYPQDYRRQHGPELVATANELSPEGWSFRQARSLAIEGFRTRARRAAGPSRRQIWFDGAALGLALWYLISATAHLTYLLGSGGDSVDVSPPAELSALAALGALGALTVTTRWPTAAAHTALAGLLVASHVLDEPRSPWLFLAASLGAHLALTVIAWWLALRGHGKRALSPTAAGALLCAGTAISWLVDSPQGTLPALVVFVGLPAVGLMLVAVDPRPILAAATIWLIVAATTLPMMPFAIEPMSILRATVPVGGCAIWLLASRFGTQRLARN